MMKIQSRKIWYYRITLIILLFAMLLAWALLPGVHEFINRSVAAFAAVDQQGIERFIQSYGALAAVVSFLLMILQAIAAPLPAFLITFANASLFGAFWGGLLSWTSSMAGAFWGGLLSWTSSMAGAALCFFIARVMGREVVEKLTGKTVLDSMDGFFTRYGKHTILVCRLLPFVPFDPISYAAGLTSIRFRSFFIATGLGQLPATIVYSWAGSMLTGGTFWFVTGLFILFALTVVIFMAKKIWLERQKRNA
ncbi:TVP38/TMEM64 family protein [Escherichia coli]|nr:TVP38/TMEM64 family protein [Escherichia coli]